MIRFWWNVLKNHITESSSCLVFQCNSSWSCFDFLVGELVILPNFWWKCRNVLRCIRYWGEYSFPMIDGVLSPFFICSSKSKIPVWPFVVLSCFGGAYALIPYFVLWRPPAPPVEESELRRWPLNFLESKITSGVRRFIYLKSSLNYNRKHLLLDIKTWISWRLSSLPTKICCVKWIFCSRYSCFDGYTLVL